MQPSASFEDFEAFYGLDDESLDFTYTPPETPHIQRKPTRTIRFIPVPASASAPYNTLPSKPAVSFDIPDFLEPPSASKLPPKKRRWDSGDVVLALIACVGFSIVFIALITSVAFVANKLMHCSITEFTCYEDPLESRVHQLETELHELQAVNAKLRRALNRTD